MSKKSRSSINLIGVSAISGKKKRLAKGKSKKGRNAATKSGARGSARSGR